MATNILNNYILLSNSEIKDKKESELDINKDIDIISSFNKIIINIKDFYDIYIKNKYIKIIKHKPMTLIIQKQEEIYTNL